MRNMRAKQSPVAATVGLHLSIPKDVHRAARLACVTLGVTWDQAAAEAFAEWARTHAAEQR